MTQSKRNLVEQLCSLGVKPGSVLYLRCSLGRILKGLGVTREVFLDAMLEALGPDGTLIVPAFTKLSPIWKSPQVFDEKAPFYTGALTKLVLDHHDAVRSRHPSHSFAAIGRRANEILHSHDSSSSCFEPIRYLVENGGRMLLAGCLTESPGFSTVHLNQYDLGLTRQHYLYKFLHGAERSKANGSKVHFRPFETPGCSMGFRKFYADYAEQGALIHGHLGNAATLSIDAQSAFAIERKVLETDPTYALCDRPTCAHCRILCGYNGPPSAIAGIRIAVSLLRKNKSSRSKR